MADCEIAVAVLLIGAVAVSAVTYTWGQQDAITRGGLSDE